MTIHVHALEGCNPRPLGSYLKSMAVLRLVSTQADHEARGWWRGETWMLATQLSKDELETFFLERYAPTPMVSPWNKGSGFFGGAAALNAIATSKATRLAAFRDAIGDAKSLLSELVKADAAVRATKSESKKIASKTDRNRLRASPEYKARLAAAEREFKALKGALLPEFRRAWRGPHLDWMQAALTLMADGSPAYPPMLGTGGNDGNFDFTNNFMQRLGELLDLAGTGTANAGAHALLRSALWGEATAGLADISIGQFAPGSAGGANSANGPTSAGRVNSWDWVLALEGAIPFAAAATRRLAANSPGSMSTPFMVRSHCAGHGTASFAEDAARGEQWLPLWSHPMSFEEVRQLLSEGRAQIDKRAARQPLELARSIARLGVARGLDAFERYGYLKRNGESNFAVPLGRIFVEPRPHANLLDDVADWMNRLQREARAKNAAARLKHAERRLSDAAFEAVTHDTTAERWQAVLLAMADIEALIATGSAVKAGPIPRLRPAWVDQADDGSPELRLAVSLGLASALDHSQRRVDSVRAHWLPLDARGRLQVKDGRLARDSRVVVHAREPVSDLVALVSRRMIESHARPWKDPLVTARGEGAHLGDIAAVLNNAVDLDRTLRLARAFMAIDRWNWTRRKYAAPRNVWPDEAWLCIRAALSPWPLVDGGAAPPGELAIVQRLAAGDAERAVELALRRLRALGLPAAVRVAVADPATSRRWAAALAFPISAKTASDIAQRLHPSTKKEGK